jgi:hypothetical protein
MCRPNHIQSRAHAQTLLVDENDRQLGPPHACNARSAIDPDFQRIGLDSAMHACNKKDDETSRLLAACRVIWGAGRPACRRILLCCASHGWDLGLRRLHVPRSSSSIGLCRARACVRTHACMHVASMSTID